MEDSEITKRTIPQKPEVKMGIGMPKSIWTYGVRSDLKKWERRFGEQLTYTERMVESQ
jgi:hypothetical protein